MQGFLKAGIMNGCGQFEWCDGVVYDVSLFEHLHMPPFLFSYETFIFVLFLAGLYIAISHSPWFMWANFSK